ncbi:MAG: ABC transporter ATP-binding protein [Gemmatimonadaceae bacterium]
MAGVKLEGLRKIYDAGAKAHVAVHAVDLEIADGELVVLVGPSGSGKSTLLRMVAGLESVSAGTLSIDGRIVNDVPAKDRDIAMVFQSYALYPHMTARKNMAFALELQRLPRREIDERVREAAAILGIEELLERKPRQLSGGQRQRVAVGRAIVRKPRVFLFDEPLSNLDAKLRVQMRREIARLHRQLGATMIYVTHDQVEAMTLGDRIVVLNEGRVQQVGTPMALYERPRNVFVAGFIGSPAMNFIPGTIEREDGGARFRARGGAFVLPLPAERRESRAMSERGRDGGDVLLGVRPEDISVAEHGAVSGRVDVVEPLGSEIVLEVRLAGEEYALTARTTPRALPHVGSEIRLAIDATRAHFFEPSTGERLGASAGAET